MSTATVFGKRSTQNITIGKFCPVKMTRLQFYSFRHYINSSFLKKSFLSFKKCELDYTEEKMSTYKASWMAVFLISASLSSNNTEGKEKKTLWGRKETMFGNVSVLSYNLKHHVVSFSCRPDVMEWTSMFIPFTMACKPLIPSVLV